MTKLKTIVRYECMTSIKYIWIFYAIQYAVVFLIVMIAGIREGFFKTVGFACLEMNTVIYIGILGVMGFSEDFKMLIQNGFTRKYIFAATLSMFCFISGIMALVDTVVGNAIHSFQQGYSSIFGSLYGYGQLFFNWLWLFLVYMLVCSTLYLAVLVINKIGKKAALYVGMALGGLALLGGALFRFVVPDDVGNRLLELAGKAMGFMTDGTINGLLPVCTLLLLVGVLGLGSYAVIRRAELKS